MKKHLDWKRIGWTVGIPLLVAFGLFLIIPMPYFLGNWVAGNEIDNWASNDFWFFKWLTGVATLTAPIVAVGIITILVKIAKGIYHFFVSVKDFYYHPRSDGDK